MATLTITNTTGAAVLVQELYASVPANGTLATTRSPSDVEGMTSFLAQVAAGTLTYAFTNTIGDLEAGAGGLGDESLVDLGAPVAATLDTVHADFDADEALNAFPGAFTNPDVPRNVRVDFTAAWDGGDVTVVGTDQFDKPQSEVIADTAGSAIAGAKIFKTVTSASKELVGVASVGASIGVGDILGISRSIVGTVINLCFEDGVAVAGTFVVADNSVEPGTVPDASINYVVLVKVV